MKWKEGKTKMLGEKPASVLVCPPQTPHELQWD
jgi:hypothetical protein